MSEIEVAEPMTVLGMRYNQQSTNPSMYQKRLQSYLYPTQNVSIQSNTSSSGALTIKFLVGSNFFLDGQNTYMVLNALMTGFNTTTNIPSGTSNHAMFTSYADTWIKSLTIYTNQGIVIEQIRDYNVLAAILKANVSENYLASVGIQSLGVTDGLTIGQRQALALANKKYVLEMRGSGFLHAKNYLALRALAGQNSNSFQIEIEFCRAAECLVAWNQLNNTVTTVPPTGPLVSPWAAYVEGTTPLGYAFSNIIISQSLVQDDIMEAQLMEIIKTVPLMIHYETFRNYQNAIQATSTAETLSISEYQESVRDMKNIFRNTNDIGQLAIDQTTFLNPQLQQYQLQIGPIYLPSQALKTGYTATNNIPDTAEQFYEYFKCNQKAGFYDAGVFPTQMDSANNNIVTNKDSIQFVLTEDMRPFPDYALGDPMYVDFISGYNTKSSPQPLQLQLVHNAAPTGGYTVNSFTHFDAYAVVQSNETYILS